MHGFKLPEHDFEVVVLVLQKLQMEDLNRITSFDGAKQVMLSTTGHRNVLVQDFRPSLRFSGSACYALDSECDHELGIERLCGLLVLQEERDIEAEVLRVRGHSGCVYVERSCLQQLSGDAVIDCILFECL